MARWRLFRPPSDLDPESLRRATLVYRLFIPANVLFIVFTTILALFQPQMEMRYLTNVAVALGFSVVILLLLRRGAVRAASVAALAVWFGLITYDALTGGGTQAAGLSAYLFLVLSAGVLSGRRAALLVTGLSIATVLAITILEIFGKLPTATIYSPLQRWIIFSLLCALFVLFHTLSRRSLESALTSANQELQERRRVEQSLRQSEEHLREFSQGAFDGLNIIDNGTIVEPNEQLAMMFGYTVEELVGMDSLALVAPESHEIGAAMRRTPTITTELIGMRKDGSRFPIEVRRRPMSYFGKQVSVVAVRDLTAQKAEEASRRHAEARYQELFENIQDGAFVIRADGSIVALNPVFERMTGFPVSDWLGRRFGELLHPDDLERARSAFSLILSGERGTPNEYRVRTGNGGYLVTEILMSSAVGEGADATFLGIARDVTERKALEEQVRRMQRLESLGALAAGIAHDLNNVLAPIMTAVQLLRQSAAGEESSGILSIVDRSARRGRDIVKQVLTFARGRSNEAVELQPRYVIKEVVSIITQTFPKNIEVISDAPRDLRSFMGNATELQQILMNLCVNARDAMENGGTLTVSARNVTFEREAGGTPAGNYVELSVADTGAGIPESIRERIFDPFFTTKGPDKGTGLGLTTVASIVRNYEGSIDVSSTDGDGTRFTVRFPALTSHIDETVSDESERLPRGNGERILVVDDELSILHICRETLEAYGYSVETASNGVEAITRVADNPPRSFQLVLTDLKMPTVDGPKLLTAIRRLDPSLSVVVMTGSLAELDAVTQEGQRETVTIISKPFTADALLHTVHDCLAVVRKPVE